MTESTFLEAIEKITADVSDDSVMGDLKLVVKGKEASASACLKIARQGQVDALEEMKYSKEELDAAGYHEEHYYKKTNSKLDSKIAQIKALMK